MFGIKFDENLFQNFLLKPILTDSMARFMTLKALRTKQIKLNYKLM